MVRRRSRKELSSTGESMKLNNETCDKIIIALCMAVLVWFFYGVM